MGKFLTFVFLLLAAPVVAQQQQQPECRGKPYFQLSGGTYGCLHEIKKGSYSKTTTWDDGIKSKHSQIQSAVIHVLLFGPYSDSKAQIKSRIQALCKAYGDAVRQQMGEVPYKDVIVVMSWPRVAGPTLASGQETFVRQAGFTTSWCRGANLFDG